MMQSNYRLMAIGKVNYKKLLEDAGKVCKKFHERMKPFPYSNILPVFMDGIRELAEGTLESGDLDIQAAFAQSPYGRFMEIQALAREYTGIAFVLQQRGPSRDTWWQEFYMDGRFYHEPANFGYEPFNEDSLKECDC